MKILSILCLALVSLACSRNRALTQGHLWTERQYIAAIDQDPGRQDLWTAKEIAPDLFLVIDHDGNCINRKQIEKIDR